MAIQSNTESSELPYHPRAQFTAFHQRSQRNALMVCHRRMGKTVACVGDLIVRALHTTQPNARFAYVAPFRQQAKEIAWTYLKDMTVDIRAEKPRESELRVKLYNGSWITLYGADNPDALRGLYFDGIILDEFGDMKPSLMGEVVLPCLADRQGFLVIIGTPKGRNQFYDYREKARVDDDWYFMEAKASTTKIIPPKELERLRETMEPAQYDQEMECNFDAAIPGRYYSQLINDAEAAGRLVDYSLYNPEQLVRVAADVGFRDSTAWWFWQTRPDGIAIIDYYENAGQHVDHYLEVLKNKGYDYADIYFPADAKAKTLATRRSTVEQFRVPASVRPDLYSGDTLLPIRIVPKLSVQHGIDAVRQLLPYCYFDAETTARGVDALRSYRRQWHEHSQTFSDTPLHDWASHAADAFRYLAVVADVKVNESRVEEPTDIKPEGYCLDDLWRDRESQDWRSNIIRI